MSGEAWVVGKISGNRIASDTNKALINYYKAVQDGYIPPDNISEDEYKSIKRKMNVNDPLTAFALLACSFGSKWASGYARDVIRNYVKEGKNSSLKYRKGIEGVHFEARSYLDYSPLDMIIYCDPPYQNTIGYNANKEKFNHDLFWATMRQWAKDNTVLISEYNAPYDFKCIKEFDHIQSIRSKNGCLKTKEKIFIYDK